MYVGRVLFFFLWIVSYSDMRHLPTILGRGRGTVNGDRRCWSAKRYSSSQFRNLLGEVSIEDICVALAKCFSIAAVGCGAFEELLRSLFLC